MSTRNPGWYDMNAGRAYPLDDTASCLSNEGDRVPSTILVDAKLTVPSTAGKVIMLGSLSSTVNLLSVIFTAVDNESSTKGVPVACLHIAKPVVIHRQYAVTPMLPGVGGWVAFGPGANDVICSMAFSHALQSKLTPRAYRIYRPLPIPDIGKPYSDQRLTGLIHLKSGNDIKIAGRTLTVAGQERRCLEIALNTQNADSAVRNVLDVYRSPCLATPESGNCGDPQPVEAIGPVVPNCCGALTLKFRGCAIPNIVTETALGVSESITLHEADGGVVLSCEQTLGDACVRAKKLPTSDGVLPNEYNDLCDSSYSVISESIPEYSPSESFTYDPLEFSEESFSYTFNPETDSINVIHYYTWEDAFTSDSGAWALLSGYMTRAKAPIGSVDTVWAMTTFHPNSLAGNNLIRCTAAPTLTAFRQKAAAVFSIYHGASGSSHNASVLAGVHQRDDGLWAGYAVEADWDSYLTGDKRLRIASFVGSQWRTLAKMPVPTLALGVDYRLAISIFPYGATGAWLLAELVSLVAPSQTIASLGPIPAENFAPAGKTLHFGLATRRAPVRFTWFGVEDITGGT